MWYQTEEGQSRRGKSDFLELDRLLFLSGYKFQEGDSRVLCPTLDGVLKTLSLLTSKTSVLPDDLDKSDWNAIANEMGVIIFFSDEIYGNNEGTDLLKDPLAQVWETDHAFEVALLHGGIAKVNDNFIESSEKLLAMLPVFVIDNESRVSTAPMVVKIYHRFDYLDEELVYLTHRYRDKYLIVANVPALLEYFTITALTKVDGKLGRQFTFLSGTFVQAVEVHKLEWMMFPKVTKKGSRQQTDLLKIQRTMDPKLFSYVLDTFESFSPVVLWPREKSSSPDVMLHAFHSTLCFQCKFGDQQIGATQIQDEIAKLPATKRKEQRKRNKDEFESSSEILSNDDSESERDLETQSKGFTAVGPRTDVFVMVSIHYQKFIEEILTKHGHLIFCSGCHYFDSRNKCIYSFLNDSVITCTMYTKDDSERKKVVITSAHLARIQKVPKVEVRDFLEVVLLGNACVKELIGTNRYQYLQEVSELQSKITDVQMQTRLHSAFYQFRPNQSTLGQKRIATGTADGEPAWKRTKTSYLQSSVVSSVLGLSLKPDEVTDPRAYSEAMKKLQLLPPEKHRILTFDHLVGLGFNPVDAYLLVEQKEDLLEQKCLS